MKFRTSIDGFWDSISKKCSVEIHVLYSYPTSPFTISHPQIPRIDKFCVVKERSATDFKTFLNYIKFDDLLILRLSNCERVRREVFVLVVGPKWIHRSIRDVFLQPCSKQASIQQVELSLLRHQQRDLTFQTLKATKNSRLTFLNDIELIVRHILKLQSYSQLGSAMKRALQKELRWVIKLATGVACPTDPSTILELQNPSYAVRELAKISNLLIARV